MRNGTNVEQNNRSKACETLTVLSQELLFSSLWSIHGWTLWHLICRADETLLCLNWSGFVSSLLSHDPLLYGSVRGGGNPLEYTALVGLLFASCRPTERMLDWSYFMLGLTLSSTRLHHISCSLLFLPFFLLYPTVPPNLTILKTPHAARKEESICYSVKLLWFFYGGPAAEVVYFSLWSLILFETILFCLQMYWMRCPNGEGLQREQKCLIVLALFRTGFVLVTKHHSDLLPTACCVVYCQTSAVCNVVAEVVIQKLLLYRSY